MKLWVPVVKVSFRQVQFGKTTLKNSKKPNVKHKRLIYTGAAGLLILVAVALVWHNLSSPGYGNVAVLSQDTTTSTKLPEYTTLTTNFYSINYSERYSQDPTDIPPAGVIDYKSLSYKLGGQPGKSQIKVLIKAAPDGGITLDKDYQYYFIQNHDKFKASNKFYHGETIDIARSIKGPPEAAGLWLHGSFLMVVKITTANSRQDLDSELKDLLSSVQWRVNS